MFVLNPDPYLLPAYRIGPFQTKDIQINNQLPDNNNIDDYFANRFKNRSFQYVADGRKAINIALQQYNLQPEDVVTIFTSSGNFYISACVTKEIEKFCQWSREIRDTTKIIFVNHTLHTTPAGFGQRHNSRAFHTRQQRKDIFKLIVWRIQHNIFIVFCCFN